MKLSIKTKIGLLCGIFITFLLLVGSFLLWSLSDVVNSFKESVQLSGNVIRNSQLLQELIIDAETGQRGYIITGKSEFLEPYKKANDKFKVVIKNLREKLKDRPKHLQALEEIEHLKLKWEGEAGEPEIRLRKLIGKSKMSLKQIDSLIVGGTGKNILDKMRAILEALERELRESNKIDELVLIVELGRAIVDSETGQRGFLLAGEDRFLEPYYKGQIVFSEKHARLNKLFKGNQLHLKKLTQIKILYEEWLAEAAKPEIEARVQFEKDPRSIEDLAVLLGEGKGKKIIDELRRKTNALIEVLDNEVNQNLSISEEKARLSKTFGLVFIPTCVIISLLINFMLANSIIKSISSLLESTEVLSNGNLNHRIEIQTNDEFGHLGNAFNIMAGQIEESFEELGKINAKLKESEEQFRGAFDNAPIGVVLINSEGHFLRVNRMFCKMLKYSSKEFKDKSVIDIVHLDDKENCNRFIQDILSGEIADTHHEIRFVSMGRNTLWVKITMALHRKYSNSQIEIILQAIDISQHKEAERIAAKVQKNLLPGILPDIPGVNIKWSIKACDELAGDTLNVFWLRDNYIGFYVIDVSGHGLAASLLSVKLSTIFSPNQIWNPSIEKNVNDNSNVALRPARLLKQLNDYFPIDLDTGQYFTIVYGYMNVETHELCFSSAGHPAPIHLSKNEKAKIIKSKSLPIGFRKDAKYNEHKIKLKSGDRIFFYTDGIIEAKAQNGEAFGLHGVTKAVNECYEKTLDTSFCLLDEMMLSWNGKTELEDDVSILALEIAK